MNYQQCLQSPKLQRVLATQGDLYACERSVLLAHYEGGLYSHHELAERLNAPLGTVKSWVRRGLAGLRECLES